MPRVTRAALRWQETQEESNVAASVPLPLTPATNRVVLGETTGNIASGKQLAIDNEDVGATKKAPKESTRGNAAKKATKFKKAKGEEQKVEVLEDDDQSTSSAAAEEASNDLLNEGSTANQEEVSPRDGRPQTPPSAAVNEAKRQLSPESKTPHFDPQIHKAEMDTDIGANTEKEDSFVANIESRTPARMTKDVSLVIDTSASSDKEDTPVEQARPRSSSKRLSRIEDSVDALDAFEEEIEKIGGLIPDTTEIQSPVKTKKQNKGPAKGAESKNISRVVKKDTNASTKGGSISKDTNVSQSTSRPSISRPRATKANPQVETIKTQKRETSGSAATGPSMRKSPDALKKRVSSVHKAPFQPTKSTKAPTKAAFKLPGEAVARKLKEQREERQKREETEPPKQQTLKARPKPTRLSHAPEIKLTAAAKARLSMARGEPLPKTSSINGTTAPKPHTRANSMAPSDKSQPMSRLSVAKRTNAPPSANTSASHAPSMTASTTTPTSEDLVHQKVKGKQVFGRARAELEERDKAKKDKEEAAKKARAEAAERGRLASREWAEKQKLRKMEAQKA